MIAHLKSVLPAWLAAARAEDLLSFTLWLALVCGLAYLIAGAILRAAKEYPYDDDL